MAELKTQKQNGGVKEFLANIPDDLTRRECQTLADMMGEASGEPGDMWGTSIVGFGQYHYKYATGREANWFKIGFSPRKQNLTLYIMNGHEDKQDLLVKLGPHTLGKACIYIKHLRDIDLDVLEAILKRAMAATNYGVA